MLYRLAALIILAPIVAGATQLLPWFGEVYEVEWRSSIAYQTYGTVASGSRSIPYASNDTFLHASLMSVFDYDADTSAEVEVTGVNTTRHSLDLDNIRLTGRYLLSDDIAGDPMSIAVGATVIQAFGISLRDVSSFHHGKLEGEVHVAFGREVACGDDWRWRWWGFVALGSADVGAPWWRGRVALEYHLREEQHLSLFAHLLEGFGSRALHPHHFHGYGNIRHKSLDVGACYTHEIGCLGSVTISYTKRVYARNFPAYANIATLSVCYPFGL